MRSPTCPFVRLSRMLDGETDGLEHGHEQLGARFPHGWLLNEKRRTYTTCSVQRSLLTLFLVHNHAPPPVVGCGRDFLVGAR